MSDLNLSKVEIPLKSKSMSTHETPEMDIISIKQIGDYILGEEIGSGAFGKVLLGKHIFTEEKVAIKVLDKMILNQTPEDYELVKNEISILKLVKHKYIVQLYEILQTAHHIFIIMEYCEGKEILDYILTKNKLSELESLKYFQQLINCLFYLHSQNIAHRDIKIDNMLLDYNKDLKLIDFGLSTKYTDDDLLDQPCGTVVYAAPEVLEGREYHGMLADVWSSGIVLYGMLAGYLPFSDKDDEVNKQLVIQGQITMPDFFSDNVKDLLKHMLDINPMTRYTLQEIKDHPWFNTVDCLLIPGIIMDYNIIPIDENIINICVNTYNKDKNDTIESIRNNKYDSNSSLYYLLIKKLMKKGGQSISDMCSDEFIDFVLDENNLINNENKNNREEILIDASSNKDHEILHKLKNNNIVIDNQKFKENDEQNKIGVEQIKEIQIENEKSKTKKAINGNLKEENLIQLSSPEKNSEEKSLKIESIDDQKKTNSPIVPKNYDVDESYPNKFNKFESKEKIDIKASEKSINKEEKIEIKLFEEKENISDEKEKYFEQIVIDDEKRLNTDTNNHNKIFEKIMNSLEKNLNKVRILDLDKCDDISENNNNKGIIALKANNNSNKLENENYIQKKDDSLIKQKIQITKEDNLNIGNIKNESKENTKEKNEIIKIKEKKIINKEMDEKNQKIKDDKTEIKDINKKIDNKNRNNNDKNNFLSNTIKKKQYYNGKTNNVLKQIKLNLTKQKDISSMPPTTEVKKSKKKLIFKKGNKNKINNNINNKKQFNFSSRNSKNNFLLINDKIKTNNKKSLKKNNKFYNVKQNTTNKIFNIINIIHNNFNSTESEIKMKNLYQSPQKFKENINISNLKKKFDDISFQYIKDLNYRNIALSQDKISNQTKKAKERNSSKTKNKINPKTNNITIIIQNKKGINENYFNGKILKSMINLDNKDKINLNSTISKKKYKDINNLELKNKKKIRTKNLESSVKEKRYKSPISIRELSESTKQKFLSKKARLERIPWKIKKKGLDKNMDSKIIYEQYKMRIKNPFTHNNSKVVNINRSKMSSFSNSIRNSLCNTKKVNKSSFAFNLKEYRLKNILPNNIKQIGINNKKMIKSLNNSKEKFLQNKSKIKNNNLLLHSDIKITNVNSLFSMSNIITNINNTDNKKYFLDIKKNSEKFIHNNALPINLKNRFLSEIENDNFYVPMNLCCLFFKKNDMSYYKNFLISKLKKNSISFTKKKNNCIVCNKNGYNCEIQIIKINNNNHCFESKNNENIFRDTEKKYLYYLKMYGKKETFGINKIFKKFVLNLE